MTVKHKRDFATNIRLDKYQNTSDERVEYDLQNTYKCPCGHSIVIYPDEFRKLCLWCHHYAYKNEEDKKRTKFKENYLRTKREKECL